MDLGGICPGNQHIDCDSLDSFFLQILGVSLPCNLCLSDREGLRKVTDFQFIQLFLVVRSSDVGRNLVCQS